MVKINKICSIQGSSVENEDAVGSQNQYFWIIDGATDLYNSKEEIGYSVSEVVYQKVCRLIVKNQKLLNKYLKLLY